jgi:uncharacterized membrane protein
MVLLLLSWYISSFNSTIDLHENGSLAITENINVNFQNEKHHGIYRDIPLDLGGKFGNFELGFRILDVKTDGRTATVKKSHIRNYGRKYLRIRIGKGDILISGKHTYEIKYYVLLGARYFKDYDELYWNITGDEWQTHIDSVNAFISFYKPIELNRSDVKLYTGKRGERESKGSIAIDETGVTIKSGGLSPGNGLTVDIKFPKSYLVKPSGFSLFLLRLKNNIPIVLGFLFFLYIFIKWWRTGREQSVGPITVRYKSPEGLTAAATGTILDEVVDAKDIVSILFDLAKKGYLKIEEQESKKFFFLKNTDYRITVFPKDKEGLKKHEKEFLNGLRKFGEEFKLSKLKGKFYTTVKSVKKSLYKNLTKDGYFHGNPETIRAKYFGLGIIITFGFPFFIILSPRWAVFFMTVGITLLAFSRGMPKRTTKGTKKLREILGFREFLARVEKPRLEKMLEENPNIFFDFLSYAVALGVADHWAERFEGLTIQSPDWYVSRATTGNIIYASVVSNSLGNLIGTVSASMAAPSSSSSGFSGGGGSSGGGGGGGGGGAW